MSKQNVYDNEVFFEGYQKIRENKVNANILFEKPALFSLLPEVKELKILDLGCGYGENCKEFVKRGAAKVTGIDLSKKMLRIARLENSAPNIDFLNIPIEDIACLDEKYDLIVSSLALHYVQDFASVCKNVHNLLNEKGLFVFSQENPLNTCFTKGDRWTRDGQGKKIYANISNYSVDGKRCSKWFVDEVIKYHRTFSSIVNTLVDSGFIIQKVLEPYPSEETIKKYPDYEDNLHKPDFLLIRAVRTK